MLWTALSFYVSAGPFLTTALAEIMVRGIILFALPRFTVFNVYAWIPDGRQCLLVSTSLL